MSKESHLLSIKAIHDHPKFQVKGQNVFFDITLLELTQPLVFHRSFYPICLYPSEFDDLKIPGLVAGWGKSKLNVHSKECQLRKGLLNLIDDNRVECLRSKAQIIQVILAYFFKK